MPNPNSSLYWDIILGLSVGICLGSAMHQIACSSLGDLQSVMAYAMVILLASFLTPIIGVQAALTNAIIMSIDVILIALNYRTVQC